jgi:hypothetical protein
LRKRAAWLLGLASLAGIGSAPGCFDTRLIPAPSGVAAENSGGAGEGPLAPGAAGVDSPGGGGSADPAGGTSGSNQAGGHAGGVAGSGLVPGTVTWLSLVGSEAPASEPPNAALGIDGRLYAYADSCATLTWDPIRRCASGQLCSAGPDYENWGIAVGFDFSATGPDGEPPDSKLVWNPELAGVRGISWRLRGNAPGVQVWVLNMDPRFRGECQEMTCEIPGPPDGAATPKLNDSLLFDQMVKDHWGGTAVTYEYDPAAVFALQFKLPAINVGSASFDFCVDALGVVH